MTLLFVDHRDSFTYNLVQYFRMLHVEVHVVDSARLSVAEVLSKPPAGIVLGPGPGTPEEALTSLALIESVAGSIPLLGVCLGHQCIATAYGARVERAQSPRHGKTSLIHHDSLGIFREASQPFTATRYHSLVVNPGSLPEDLIISATSDDGVIMAIRHRSLAVEGVQFHPESVVTAEGMTLLRNFVESTQTALQEARTHELQGYGG